MARVFISHSSRDREQAEEIFAWLKAQGFEQGFLDIDKHQGIPPGGALGAEALRRARPRPGDDPDPHPELVRFEMVLRRVRPGALARQGDLPADLRARRRPVRRRRPAEAQPRPRQAGRPRAPRAAAHRGRADGAGRLRLPARPRALSRLPLLRRGGCGDLFRPRRRRPQADPARRLAPHRGRAPLHLRPRRVRHRQVLAAPRRPHPAAPQGQTRVDRALRLPAGGRSLHRLLAEPQGSGRRHSRPTRFSRRSRARSPTRSPTRRIPITPVSSSHSTRPRSCSHAAARRGGRRSSPSSPACSGRDCRSSWW